MGLYRKNKLFTCFSFHRITKSNKHLHYIYTIIKLRTKKKSIENRKWNMTQVPTAPFSSEKLKRWHQVN